MIGESGLLCLYVSDNPIIVGEKEIKGVVCSGRTVNDLGEHIVLHEVEEGVTRFLLFSTLGWTRNKGGPVNVREVEVTHHVDIVVLLLHQGIEVVLDVLKGFREG